MSGSPLRPDRDSFGPEVENSAPVRDSRRQWSADIANLVMWQCAGLGLVAPRVMLQFTAQVGPVLLARAETWNPRRLSTGAYADPTLTRSGVGDYLIEYPTPVPDETGTDVAIALLWAQAFVVNANPTVLKHAQAAVVVGNPNRIRVGVFNTAHALEDGNTLVVCGW